MRARRYSISVLTIVTAIAVSVGAFNLFVDPYMLWRDGGHVGFAGDDLGRLTKAHWIDGYGADLVILGNSHARGGFSEDSFVDRGLAKRPFNGALPAGLIYELRRYFQHYAELSDLRAAVVVIDILNFLDIPPIEGAFDEDRLAITPDGEPNPNWKLADFAFTNLTGAALQASYAALVRGKRTDDVFSGFRRCSPKPSKFRPGRAVAMLGANHQRFRAGAYLDEATTFDWRKEMSALFAEAARREIRLYVVIPPAHVTYYMELDAAGYWDDYLSIVSEAARLAAKAGGDIEVYDFTGFGKVQTEPLRADKPSIYWRDTNHFSCHTGDLIVARIAGQPVAVDGFGVRVTGETAAAHLARLEAEIRDWPKQNRRQYCRYFKAMPQVVRDALKESC